jgi:hypothetical protein
MVNTRSAFTASSIRARSAAWTILLDWTSRSRTRADIAECDLDVAEQREEGRSASRCCHDGARCRFDAKRFAAPAKKNCADRRCLFFAFSKLDQGRGQGSICGFPDRPGGRICFCFFNAARRGDAWGRAPGRADRGQHLTQLPDWYGLGQLRYCVLANPVLMAKPCPISMPS